MTAPEIVDLVRHGAGEDVEVTSHSQFTDSFFNAVYAVTLSDGRDLVLKVAPDPGLKLLRYEVDLMHTEVEFFRRAGNVGVPLPGIVAAQPYLGYLLMRRLEGRPLESVKERMTDVQLARVRHQLGTICRRLRHVSGPMFGYPRRDGHTHSASWRTSFLTMIDDILTDAVEYRRELPAPAGKIRGLVEKHAELLDEVTTPALVHFDLWDGNVFVVPDGDGYRVEGIIDGERAFYGDPIAELTSLAFFTDPEQAPGVLDGFLGRPLTGSERTRLSLYRVYLYLIMVTEGAPRGFDPIEHEPTLRYVLGELDAELTRL